MARPGFQTVRMQSITTVDERQVMTLESMDAGDNKIRFNNR